MRKYLRVFICFFYILMITFGSSVIAVDDDDDDGLVDIEIPSWESVTTESKYLNPTLEFTKTMTQWANACTANADSLNTAGNFLGLARDDAKENAYSQDSQSFDNLVNRIKLVVTKDWTSALVDFVQQLNSSSGKIDREQAFALACQAVNKHYILVNDAKDDMDDMYKVAEQVRANYVANLTSPSELDETH